MVEYQWSRKYEIIEVLQPYGPQLPVRVIAFPEAFIYPMKYLTYGWITEIFYLITLNQINIL